MERRRFIRRLAAASGALVLAAMMGGCGMSGGYQRGIFIGYVTDATDDEIASKVGKPDQVDGSDPNAVKWIYVKKTFDPDNMNKVDEKTIVVLKKDAAGKLKGNEVLFL